MYNTTVPRAVIGRTSTISMNNKLRFTFFKRTSFRTAEIINRSCGEQLLGNQGRKFPAVAGLKNRVVRKGISLNSTRK